MRHIIDLLRSLNPIDPLHALDECRANERFFCLEGGSPTTRRLLAEMIRRRTAPGAVELRTLDEHDTMAALGWLAALTPGHQVGPDQLSLTTRTMLEIARHAEMVERVLIPELAHGQGVLLVDRSLWRTR